MTRDYTIGIIGLGYVGLPLAIAFAEHFNVVGFDINQERVSDLNQGIDSTDEADLILLQKAIVNRLQLSSDLQDLAACNVYIVTVPTPITQYTRFNVFDIRFKNDWRFTQFRRYCGL